MMGAATVTLIPGTAMAKRASSPSVRRPKAAATASAMASMELLVRARSGDANALNDLCARYLPRMQKWAHGRLPAWARGALDTHDLVQDALAQVIQRLGSFEPRHDGAFQAFLRTALLNRIRICASGAVLREAEQALALITEQYFSPNLSLEQIRALVRDGAKADPLRGFAEACRVELRSMHTTF